MHINIYGTVKKPIKSDKITCTYSHAEVKNMKQIRKIVMQNNTYIEVLDHSFNTNEINNKLNMIHT